MSKPNEAVGMVSVPRTFGASVRAARLPLKESMPEELVQSLPYSDEIVNGAVSFGVDGLVGGFKLYIAPQADWLKVPNEGILEHTTESISTYIEKTDSS